MQTDLYTTPWKDPQCAKGQHEVGIAALTLWEKGEGCVPFDVFCKAMTVAHDHNPVGSILEVGCGCGYYSRVIQKAFPGVKYFGVDPSPMMIALAKNTYLGKFFEGTGEAIPFVDKSFDCVVLGCMLGICSDWQQCIREAFRVAKKWVLLHRVAVGVPTEKKVEHYGVEMMERVISGYDISLICKTDQGGYLAFMDVWSCTENGHQGCFLYKV